MDNGSSKDQFLSHMVSEMQIPLKAVLKLSESLLKNSYDANNREQYLKLIHNSAKNIDNIIKDVSDISSIQNGTFSINITKINLMEFLSQNFELFRLKAKEKSLRFSIKFGKNLPKFIDTDENRLSQVISNLLTNAIKFTEKEGSVKLEVVFDTQNSLLKVYVDDNGIGIPDSKKENIFKPFIRDKSNVNFEDTRTGLGLFISLSIIELLNGKIGFESKQGQGSTFHFEIPVKFEN
ncbi:HAMP domain-containing histidine kinase [Sulfurimonas lithotrophica]|uniref:histidine kinase n=1 Tax=Sulfurimonas lithotrophica TaxID=2590022 RepID=A0A5P8P088_9BACT|nr:HAMP domain-containing sensor histidine kinase [Sulfurimonas lithotrophica]QFR49010.1 HAMP domain-containing histidine kinase [Sulfurimonas lithotrophica]